VPDPVISTRDLTCRFGPTVAVDRLTIDVHEGEVFGILGHNGAGKTTLVRLLNGVLEPSSGTARVFGLAPVADGTTVRRSTGVLTETPSLDERLTARENLLFFAALYDELAGEAAARVDQLLNELGLADRGNDRVGTYSKGMRQRVALARLLLHDPRLLFLDEPTAGLDPAASKQLRDRVRMLSRTQMRTVLLCTHNLVEADQLCDRVAVLARGRLLALGTPRELRERLTGTVEVLVEIDPVQHSLAAGALEGLGFPVPTADGAALTLTHVDRSRVPELVAALASTGVRVFRVEPRTPTLEDVYFSLQAPGAGP
jgi:ABC-2 type transport system ATP-binding protein